MKEEIEDTINHHSVGQVNKITNHLLIPTIIINIPVTSGTIWCIRINQNHSWIDCRLQNYSNVSEPLSPPDLSTEPAIVVTDITNYPQNIVKNFNFTDINIQDITAVNEIIYHPHLRKQDLFRMSPPLNEVDISTLCTAKEQKSIEK